MEGPGGYQLFGRTIQAWNTWRRVGPFTDAPWLLRFFDRIRFFPVDAQELAEAREAFPHGAYPVQIDEGSFCWADEQRALAADTPSITRFKTQQQAAFEAERARWRALGLDSFAPDEGALMPESEVPDGLTGVHSPVPGNLWKYLIAPGDRVAAGATIAIVESMKMEIAVQAPAAGRLAEMRAIPGRTLRAGDILAVMEAD